MRIVSSFFLPISFPENTIQHFLFQDLRHQSSFRLLLDQYINNQLPEHIDFAYLDNDFDIVSAKKLHILQIFGGELHTLEEKSWKQHIFQKIVDQMEIDYIQLYENIKQIVESNLTGLNITVDNFHIELDYEAFHLMQLQKYIKWDIKELSEKESTILDQIKFMLSLWESLSNGKETIIIYHFPEVDMSYEEYQLFQSFVKTLSIRVICITRSKEWMMQFPLEYVHFIKQTKEEFTLQYLKAELMLLVDNINHQPLSIDALTISIAYEEIIIFNPLLSETFRNFIDSSNF